MQKEGAISGVSDLILAVPNKDYSALFIEMKIKPNKQSQNQKKFQQAVERFQCYKYIICYDFEQFKNEITQYLKG